jgi:hypothetical protein
VTGPAIALAALVILVWALALLAGTLGTIDENGSDAGDEA